MPNYIFASTEDEDRIVEKFYHMNEAPSIGSVIKDENGESWVRLAVKPQASFDTKVDPYSSSDFVKATNKQGTLGDLWDRSKEMRLKREDKEGKGNDPYHKKFFSDYEKKRGKKHPDQVRSENTANLAKRGIKIDWGDDD